MTGLTDEDEQLAQVERRDPRTVRWRGEPLFVAASPALAAEIVSALNRGAESVPNAAIGRNRAPGRARLLDDLEAVVDEIVARLDRRMLPGRLLHGLGGRGECDDPRVARIRAALADR